MTKSELADWLCLKLEADRASIESWLARGLSRAELEWPSVRVPLDVFGRFVLERLSQMHDLERELADVDLAALYLACALGRGEPEALRQFDAKILSSIDGALARVVDRPAEREEIRQRIREKLLVGEPPRPPRIVEYRGTGDLRAWVAVVGVRMALNQARARKREQLVDPSVLGDASLASEDPELFVMQREVRADFEHAVKQALERISVRERNLLRHYFLDRLGIDELGAMYGVHRATAARWIARARERVRDQTRSILIERAKLREPEAESVMRLLDSQLELSLGGILITREKQSDE